MLVFLLIVSCRPVLPARVHLSAVSMFHSSSPNCRVSLFLFTSECLHIKISIFQDPTSLSPNEYFSKRIRTVLSHYRSKKKNKTGANDQFAGGYHHTGGWADLISVQVESILFLCPKGVSQQPTLFLLT